MYETLKEFLNHILFSTLESIFIVLHTDFMRNKIAREDANGTAMIFQIGHCTKKLFFVSPSDLLQEIIVL